jgi:hypothetical protein
VARGLDHIVHAVRDLDAAAALYRRLGFQVGARNRHPPEWGTQNHIVQFPGCFVELLAMADLARIAPHAPRYFSFGAFNRDFLARGEGLSMLALEGSGAADAHAFHAAGIGDFEPYDFAREAWRPDGTPVKVAFTLAFASTSCAPDAGFFTCQQHHPENFWNPAFQTHANGVSTVAGIVLVADRPGDLQTFLSAFSGGADWHATESGVEATTPRGTIAAIRPRAFIEQYSVPPPEPARGARLAALRFSVRDFEAAAALLEDAGPAARLHRGRIVIGPDETMGATLVFESGCDDAPAEPPPRPLTARRAAAMVEP